MTQIQSPSRQRVRIASHVTQSRFLHVEDALNIGKLRLFAGTFRRGSGLTAHTAHFLDLADARVVFAALAAAKAGFSFREYKGTPPAVGAGAISRVLSVAVKGDHVYVELKSGPGKLTATGAITPAGRAGVEVNVGFKPFAAQRLAATVLAYVRAWDVHRLMVHQRQLAPPVPFELAPTAAGGVALSEPVGAGEERPQSVSVPEARGAGNGNRPVTRKGMAVKADNGRRGNGEDRPVVPVAVKVAAAAVYGAGDLRYGDGSVVAADNVTEVEAFQRFVVAKKNRPAARAVLLVYYRGESLAA